MDFQHLERLVAAGLSIIPIGKNKMPAIKSWKPFQERLPAINELETWAQSTTAIACVCGYFTGVECIDIDTKNDTRPEHENVWQELQALIRLTFPDEFIQALCVQKTPSGGRHIFFKSSVATGNMKLAMTPQGKAIIETRGTGGYALIQPSPGYTVIHGSFETLPVITPEQRADLLAICRSLNQRVDTHEAPEQYKATRSTADGDISPGDDYNARGDALALLQQHGWRVAFTKEATSYLTRPGKTRGVSATWNYNGSNKLMIFSTSAVPFADGRAYQPFAIYAILEHDGSFKQAAKALRKLGYGTETKAEPMEFDVDAGDSPTQAGMIRQFLVERYEFRYNVVTGVYEYRTVDSSTGWAQLQDYDLNSIWADMESNKIKVGVQKIGTIVQSNFSPKYDPFKSYIAGLPRHDGEDYIFALACTTLPVRTQREVWVDYLRRFLVAHIAQIITGQANHTALILQGEQGVGKTTWLNRLCPRALQQDYLYVGDIDAASKDSQLLVAERWLINLDELETMARQEVGHLKSLFTQSRILTRRPYAHYAESLPRRASFVGSVNRAKFLTDDTGNRRFLVVEMEQIDAGHDVDIDRVWAQALYLMESGFRWWFDTSEIQTINQHNEQYRVLNMAEEIVEQYLAPAPTNDTWNFMTTTQIIERLTETTKVRLPVNDYFVRQLGAALKRSGFSQGYVSKDRRRGWFVTLRTATDEAAKPEQPDLF